MADPDPRIHETNSMMCDVGAEDVYLSAIWQKSGEPEWMAILWKKRGDEYWQFRYRFRYDAGTDRPEDDDKSHYFGIMEGEEIECIEKIDFACKNMPFGEIPEKYPIQAWGEEAADKFIRLPFSQVRPLIGDMPKA